MGAVTVQELFNFLNNSFVLVVAVALIKAVYVLFKMNIQTNINTKDIEKLQAFTGFHRRKGDNNNGL